MPYSLLPILWPLALSATAPTALQRGAGIGYNEVGVQGLEATSEKPAEVMLDRVFGAGIIEPARKQGGLTEKLRRS